MSEKATWNEDMMKPLPLRIWVCLKKLMSRWFDLAANDMFLILHMKITRRLSSNSLLRMNESDRSVESFKGTQTWEERVQISLESSYSKPQIHLIFILKRKAMQPYTRMNNLKAFPLTHFYCALILVFKSYNDYLELDLLLSAYGDELRTLFSPTRNSRNLLRTSKFSTWFLENEFQTSDYILTCNQQLLTLSAACNTCQWSVD